MTNTIFWNIDTQYDFMRDDASHKGKLPVPGARGIEENLERLTQYARVNGIKVVNTADWHTFASKEFSQTPDYVATFPPHCIMHTPGAKFIPATTPVNAYDVDWRAKDIDEREIHGRRNITIYKDAFDAFDGNPHTGKIVDLLKPQRAIVYGVATNYCVDSEVQRLLERGIDVHVVTDAMKAIVTPEGTIPMPTGRFYGSVEEFMNREWRAKGVHLETTLSVERLLAGR